MPALGRKPLILGSIFAALFATGVWARLSLGIELDPRSIRDFVLSLGPAGPFAFVLLIVFRTVLGVPSQLVLIAAGLCFGTVMGTLYGGAGLALSGVGMFLLARATGREGVRAHIPKQLQAAFDAGGSRLGAGFIAIGTGYPFGPVTAYHAIAGITDMRLASFTVAVGAGSLVRAATYTFFGSRLVDGDPTDLAIGGAALIAATLLPLCFSRPRSWLLGAIAASRESRGGVAPPS